MKKRQRMLYGKRLLVAFLSACMLVANTPLSALAAEEGGKPRRHENNAG